MRFVCDSCRAQYMISDEKVGPKGVKVRCKKCGYVILVKKADASGHAAQAPKPVQVQSQPAPPVPLSNDPDDALATQVMMNPLDGPPTSVMGQELDNTAPGINEEKTSQMPAQGTKEGLLDASEDEIGAVFDQVLNSGAHSIPKGAKGEERTDLDHQAMGDQPDDRMSTRVIDADVVRKLADETGGDGGEAKNGANGNGHGGKEVPKTDWFVAIDDKQTGPLTLDNIKQHWERGEIGPDSLCWRAGFSDWVPVSEVADLAAELAPRPSKPVMVSPVSVGGSMGGGGVMSVPVESAFSAGGMMKSVRSEVQVPLAAANPEETGSWRPSAASALASLVKEEMEALAKPAPPPVVDDPVGVGDSPSSSPVGLLGDLPEASIVQPAKPKVNGNNGHAGKTPLGEGGGEMTAAHGPRNPYIANPGATYSSPAVTQYRPDRGPNTTLIAILVLGGVAVLGIVAFVIVSVMKPAQPVVVAQQQPTVQQPVQPPANANTNAQQPNPNPNTVAQPNPQNPPAAANTNTPPPANGNPPGTTNTPQPTNTQPANTNAAPAKQPVKVAANNVTAPPKAKDPTEKPAAKEKPEPAEKPEKKSAEPKGGDDEFAAAFGGGDKPSKKEAKTEKGSEKPADDSSSKRPTVYVPPAPGAGGNIQESLGQADIMEVVKGNIASIKKCVDEQKTKEPGTTGKLVMKWTIKTDGKTTKVEVVSEEFKSTYLAGCVGGLIKQWQFPKHKTQGEPVVFPFKF